jgi:uncharacterized repeat protein (TIGR03803 family)
MRSNTFLAGLRRAVRIDFFLALTLGLALLASAPAHAQTFTVLHAFTGVPDGKGPDSSLVLDAEGDLYGTTEQGGASYHGSLFEVAPDDKEKILYSFVAAHGAEPNWLVGAAGGTLYGTTSEGGAYNRGAVFELDKKSHETVLYSFRGDTDGEWPNAVMRGADGNFYGTTEYGGDTGCYAGCGTVFKLTPSGNKTTLYTFTGGADGAVPVGGLVQDSAGNLYGVTGSGGNLSCNDGYGCGTVFEVDAAGKETVLYSFIGGNDGTFPVGLIRDQEGNFYGTTSEGGTFNNGTVFKLDTGGQENVLYSFSGGADGGQPVAGLVLDAAGNIYGTTEFGGAGTCGCGNVFMLDTSGKETVLHSFTWGADGALPVAGVVLDASGNIYGTAILGGDLSCGYNGEGCGTVFKITP